MTLKGPDVDIVTGKLKELVEQEKKAKAQIQARRLMAEGEEVEKELRGAKGRKLAKTITEQLERRITEIMQTDPECLSYTNILNSLNIKINVGRKMAEKLVQQKIGGKND